MIDQNKLKHLKKYAESLTIKYDLFYLNRENKNKHFKSDNEYSIIQKNLSAEIEMHERDISVILKDWFAENFKNIIFIVYDSRFLCIKNDEKRLGKVLLKNADDVNLHKLILQKFNKDTEFEIIIDSYEELPETIKKKFTF